MTESIIVAVVSSLATLAVALFTVRGAIRKAEIETKKAREADREAARAAARRVQADVKIASDALYSQLCKDQQLRIDQLTKRIVENDARIDALQEELCALRDERERLEGRVAELEKENEDLRKQIEALQRKRVGR